MQRLISTPPDDLRPEDLQTDEQPRARDPPRTPWWLPDTTTSWLDVFLMTAIYCLPAITLLLKDC